MKNLNVKLIAEGKKRNLSTVDIMTDKEPKGFFNELEEVLDNNLEKNLKVPTKSQIKALLVASYYEEAKAIATIKGVKEVSYKDSKDIKEDNKEYQELIAYYKESLKELSKPKKEQRRATVKELDEAVNELEKYKSNIIKSSKAQNYSNYKGLKVDDYLQLVTYEEVKKGNKIELIQSEEYDILKIVYLGDYTYIAVLVVDDKEVFNLDYHSLDHTETKTQIINHIDRDNNSYPISVIPYKPSKEELNQMEEIKKEIKEYYKDKRK